MTDSSPSRSCRTFEDWLAIVAEEYPDVQLTRIKTLTRAAWFAAAAALESSAPSESGWIPVAERLPENTNNVIAYYVNSFGHGRRIRAFYAKQHQMEDTSDDGMDDAEEHNGTTYIPAGWYETNEAEDYYYRAEGNVTHWHLMPEGPK